ncbi:MAG: PDZ domain-containing protein [Coraliomargaritaceae bacterium]
MTQHLTTVFLTLLLLASSSLAAPFQRGSAFDAKQSIVEIEVTRTSYNYKVPWVSGNAQTRKNGIVISGKHILTTADGFSGQYLCRVRKGGQSRHYTAEILWVDYHTNIALLEVKETLFWEGMRPVELAKKLPMNGNLKVYRWRSGRIESRAAEIIRLFVGKSKTSYTRHLSLAVSSEINAAGWAEVVIHKNRLIGLTSSGSDQRLTILPAPYIQFVLDGHKGSNTPGAGFFDFDWMEGKNPALLHSKAFDGDGTGIVITEIGKRGLSKNTLQSGDILFEIDGYPVDHDGKYIDPDYGRLSIDGLATRSRFAGERIAMKVWREGAEKTIDYQLPQADFTKSVIPEQCYDCPPEYLIAGGLVFQPLTGPLLRALGQNTPLLLDYYEAHPPIGERSGLVLLSMVLPDDYNRGYESVRLQLIDQINGRTIDSLADVEQALREAEEGYHKIRFMPDESMIHMILDAEQLEGATDRILERYRIPQKSVMNRSNRE